MTSFDREEFYARIAERLAETGDPGAALVAGLDYADSRGVETTVRMGETSIEDAFGHGVGTRPKRPEADSA